MKERKKKFIKMFVLEKLIIVNANIFHVIIIPGVFYADEMKHMTLASKRSLFSSGLLASVDQMTIEV